MTAENSSIILTDDPTSSPISSIASYSSLSSDDYSVATALTTESVHILGPHYFVLCTHPASAKDLASLLTELPLHDKQGQYVLLAAQIVNPGQARHSSEAAHLGDVLAALGKEFGDDTMFTSQWCDIGSGAELFSIPSML